MKKQIFGLLAVLAIVALVSTDVWALAVEHDITDSGKAGAAGLATGACGYCHVPHGADAAGVRLAANAPAGPGGFGEIAGSFCAVCHYDNATMQGYGAHNGSATMLNAANNNHPVNAETKAGHPDTAMPTGFPYGDAYASAAAGSGIVDFQCTSCHNPHDNANGTFLRAAKITTGNLPGDTNPVTFCANCHSERETVDGTETTYAWSHPVNLVRDDTTVTGAVMATNDMDGDADADINNFGPHILSAAGANVTLATGGYVTCETCHMPHDATSSLAILSKTATIASDMCGYCHDRAPVSGNTARSHPVYHLGVDDSTNPTTGLTAQAFPDDRGSITDTGRAWPGASAGVYSTPAPTNVTCQTCHEFTDDGGTTIAAGDASIHRSATSRGLAYAPEQICIQCHGTNPGYYMLAAPAVAPGGHQIGQWDDDAGGDGAAWHPGASTITFTDDQSGTSDALWGTTAAYETNCMSCHMPHNAALGALRNLGGTDTTSGTNPDDVYDSERALLRGDNVTNPSGMCIECHAPAGTHPTTSIADTAGANDANLSDSVPQEDGTGTRALDLTAYGPQLASKTSSNMVYFNSAEFYCQSCHNVHVSAPSSGTFTLREASDTLGTGGTLVVPTSSSIPEPDQAASPPQYNRDLTCGTAGNAYGCHNL